MILSFRPIKVWPEGWQDPNRARDYSPFASTYSKTLAVLDRELTHLYVIEATLQVDARPSQVRLDGQLKADARVEHPGVILTIDTKAMGTLVYSCDRFTARYSGTHWHENLRAIALGLEALRRVERYGIANRGEQYAGYKEIGSGIPLGQEAPASMTADEAALFMARAAWPSNTDAQHFGQGEDYGNVPAILDDPDIADLAYRLGAKRLHPDVGGDAESFKTLNEARRVVARAFR